MTEASPYREASTQETSCAGAALAGSPLDRDPLAAGALIGGGRFRILERIGRGGMGIVHRARDEKLGEEVAIKVIRPGLAPSASAKERFLREVKLARRLAHPGIVRIFELGEEGGVLFVVMELLEGEDLARAIERRGPLGIAEAVRIAMAACEALDVAHREGVVHRDIKPRNVFLCADGRVKLLDFGLARALVAGEGASGESGALVGTPAYMAPEQILPDRFGRPDARADLYSVALVLYEALTGRHPFAGEDPFEVALKRLAVDPAPPRTHDGRIPRGLERVVLGGLSMDPASRTATATSLARALAPWSPAPARGRLPIGRLGAIAAAGVLLVAAAPLAAGALAGAMVRGEIARSVAIGDLPRAAAVALRCLPAEGSREVRAAVGLAALDQGRRALDAGRSIQARRAFVLAKTLGAQVRDELAETLEARAREIAARNPPPPTDLAAAGIAEAPSAGRIVIRSPRPVTVYLDGSLFGRTPFDAEAALGLHRLALVDEATGRRVEEIVTLGADRPIERDWPAD